MQPQPDDPSRGPERPALRLATNTATPVPEAEQIPPGDRSVYAAIAEHITDRVMVVANPENHLIAALLNASRADAAAVLALVEEDDLQGYLPGVAFGLIRQLVDNGHEPTPQQVITRARGGLDITPRPSLKTLVLYVSEVFTMNMPVRPWAAACDVVEDSYRRHFEEIGIRMAQMAAAFADVEELEELTGEAVRRWKIHRKRVHELRRRAIDGAKFATAQPATQGRPPAGAACLPADNDEAQTEGERPASV
ncbi:hypothetical protein [Nocardia carnea]|uniref:hypothetical protein n=1 Tax=Nocardia carnea TaxID=37328 RepID=UPI0002EB56D3|nr:hypothetical protein [Nocardia carnea]